MTAIPADGISAKAFPKCLKPFEYLGDSVILSLSKDGWVLEKEVQHGAPFFSEVEFIYPLRSRCNAWPRELSKTWRKSQVGGSGHKTQKRPDKNVGDTLASGGADLIRLSLV